jgi:hypothetical protein
VQRIWGRFVLPVGSTARKSAPDIHGRGREALAGRHAQTARRSSMSSWPGTLTLSIHLWAMRFSGRKHGPNYFQVFVGVQVTTCTVSLKEVDSVVTDAQAKYTQKIIWHRRETPCRLASLRRQLDYVVDNVSMSRRLSLENFLVTSSHKASNGAARTEKRRETFPIE